MDTTLRNALIYGALPAMAIIIGGSAVLFRTPRSGLVRRIQEFAAGALFSIITLELLPDLLFAHQVAAMTAFAIGIAVMIGLKWLTGKLSWGADERLKPPNIVLTEAVIYLLLTGLLIGSGFVAGLREGLMLTAALTTEGLAIALVTATSLHTAAMQRRTIILLLFGLALLILASAAAGATLMWQRTGVDLDVVLAFGMAALLLRALEAMVEAREDHSAILSLMFFFAGAILFLILASWLGGKHSDHPGRRTPTTSSPHNHPSGEAHESFTFSFTRFGQ